MKLSLALVSVSIASASAVREISQVKAQSKMGMDLLSKARRVEEDGDAEVDQTWIAGMSLKFEGCHHISQWNADAEDAEDVRIESMRLAKFRLCPSDSCSQGCKKGYGDYIVDMNTFLASYLQNKEEVEEENCEYYLENKCNCEDGDDKGDDFDAEQCEQTCFANAGMDECYEIEADDDANQQNEFELNNYLECAQYEVNNGRRLDGAYYEAEEVEYFIGSYCASQGGSVVLGLFTDDACTNFADSNGGRTTFYGLEGTALPYSEQSIVNTDCWSCEQTVEQEDDQYYVAAETKEICSDVYDVAGKCETNLYTDNEKNVNACSYMSGIRTTSKNGIMNAQNSSGNKVASAFISIFGISFVMLGSYVYYLKTKLDRGTINLTD